MNPTTKIVNTTRSEKTRRQIPAVRRARKAARYIRAEIEASLKRYAMRKRQKRIQETERRYFQIVQDYYSSPGTVATQHFPLVCNERLFAPALTRGDPMQTFTRNQGVVKFN